MTHASRHVGALAEHAAYCARLGAFPLLALSPLSGIAGQLQPLAILRSAQSRDSGARERQEAGEGEEGRVPHGAASFASKSADA